MRSLAILLLMTTSLVAQRAGQKMPDPTLLWPNGAPGAAGTEDLDKPSITPYLAAPASATGTAVVVCPGGGYGALAMDHEGDQVARWLNSIGVSAFVLKYRLAPRYHHPAMITDVQRAIRYVRSHAADYHIAQNRIGVWGFSAGGHLASTASTHFDFPTAKTDAIDNLSARPDFAVLAYPVISFTTSYVHKGSMRNLLGDNPDPKLVELFSNELQVTKDTPPTFLFSTNADTGVPAENSVLYYLALRKAGVPAEIHVYEKGPHGMGLAWSDAALSTWPGRLADWMRGRGLLNAKGQ